MWGLQVHTIMQSQTESLHASMGLVREASQCMSPPAVLVTDSSGERDLSDQLLETWMLLEYCDQGNLESAAREARFQRDYVSAPHCFLLALSSGAQIRLSCRLQRVLQLCANPCGQHAVCLRSNVMSCLHFDSLTCWGCHQLCISMSCMGPQREGTRWGYPSLR